MRGAYGISIVSILLLLLLPIISAIPVLAPCVPLSIPLTHLAQYTVRVAPPFDMYLRVTNHILNGQLPCTVTGIHNIPLVLNGNIKQKVQLAITADYSFSVMQKEALIGCTEEILTKQFILRNNGNVPNIYTLTGATLQKIVLGPGKETLFTVSHRPEDPVTHTLTIETTYGKKRQRYALSWETKPCVALWLSVPEEVETCAGKEGRLTYSIENNGTAKEEITAANETFYLAPGEKITKSITLTDETKTFLLSLQVRNKTIKAPVKIQRVSQCNKITAPSSIYLLEETGTFSLQVTNSGTEETTYTFETEHPEIHLQTKSLRLNPAEKSDLVFSYTNISRNELLLIAQTANETQTIHVYINTGKSFITWSWLGLSWETYASYAGLVVIVLVVLVGGILFWRGQKEDDKGDEIDLTRAKPSWFMTYDHIDFDHLFDETEEGAPPTQVQPRKTYFRTLLNAIISLFVLSAGGMLAGKYPFLALGLGSVCIVLGVFWLLVKKGRSIPWKKIAAGVILIITLALFFFLISRDDTWNTYVPAMNITRAFSEYTLPSTLDFSPALLIFGACFSGFLLLALLKKGWKTWKQWRERRKKEQEIAALATKIAYVERKTRSLKNSLLRKSFMTRLLDFFYPETEQPENDHPFTTSNIPKTINHQPQPLDHMLPATDHKPSSDHVPKPIWRYFIDFFFEDIPEDFTPVESASGERKEEVFPISRKRRRNTRKNNRRKKHVKSSR